MVSMLVGRSLTQAEEARLQQLDGPLAGVFASAGRGVRVCEGYYDGDRRAVRFIEGLVGPGIASLSSDEFVNGSEQAVLARLEQQLGLA